MYLRAVHAEPDVRSLRKFIRDNPLGILITALPSPNVATIQCTHVPWVLDVSDETSEDETCTLRGHLAKANPHAKILSDTARASPRHRSLMQEVSVLFNGPAHSYVTPKFYTETKPSTGKVVPTWNYSAVQASGTASIFYDTGNDETDSFLQRQIEDLTAHSEGHIMRYTGGDNASPWEVDDAPETFVKLLKKSIIGIEIKVSRLEGKYKMSQEMGISDRQGIIDGFRALGTDNAQMIAETVKERGALKDSKAAK